VRLNPGELPAIQRLFAEEAPGLPDGFVQPRGEVELMGYLDGSAGQAFGVFDDRLLQAVGLLRLPEPEAFAGQPTFPFVPSADWPQLTAFGECVLVRKWVRGRGHQRALIKARALAAQAAGRRWFCAGVHVENRRSWRNLLLSGFLLVGCRAEPNPRFGFLRPLHGTALPLRPQTVARVRLDDPVGLQAALAAGLVGAALEEGQRLLFRHPAQASGLSTTPARAA
jgi:hypothetical protein